MTPLGPQLRALRQRAGLRQTELASVIGVSQSLISQVENGKEATTTDVLARWIDACAGDVVIEDADSLALRAALARMDQEDCDLLVRIAQSLPDAPGPAKAAMTMAFEQLASRR